MPKRKPIVKLDTYGIYRGWDAASKDLPKISEFTTVVEAIVDVEFGLVVNIKNAKNKQLEYCIDHPGILDDGGKLRAPFDGVVYVRSNDWNFYLGDTIWEPISDKLGDWRMTLELDGQIVADKTFEVIEPMTVDTE